MLAIHAEDPEIIEKATRAARLSGAKDLAAFSASRPPVSETQAVNRVIRVQQSHNARVLICHASVPQSIENIVAARSGGVNIYCETCPHYLLLCQESVEIFGPYARVKPPIRPEALRRELLKCLKEGLIDIISSDHAPYLPSEKERGQSNIWDAPDGIPGIELSLPLLLNKVGEGEFSYGDIVRVFSENPAKLLGLYPLKGSLEEGTDADIIIVKPGVIKKNQLNNLFSKSKGSGKVYEGWELSHSVEKTLCRGKVVFESGRIVGQPGYGEYVSPIKSGQQ
jgi:dihydroorotase-like cyclic amidohydrolase